MSGGNAFITGVRRLSFERPADRVATEGHPYNCFSAAQFLTGCVSVTPQL
jgi:hypothetical protein